MSQISTLMTQFVDKHLSGVNPQLRGAIMIDLVTIAKEAADTARRNIAAEIKRRAEEAPQKPEGFDEFVALVKEFATDRTHTDEGDGPVCSLCSGFVKPQGRIDHDPACLTLRARKFLKDLGVE